MTMADILVSHLYLGNLNVTTVRLCMIMLLDELFLFLVTMTILEGHNSVDFN